MVGVRINVLTWDKGTETIMPRNLSETPSTLKGIGLSISWGNKNIYFMDFSK